MEARIAPVRALTLALIASLLAAATLPAPAAGPAAAGPPPAASAATATVYNVEIIVFRAAGALGGAENWNAEAGARYIAGDESASDSLQVGRFVAALPPAVWQLNELENRLRASGTYVPVAHAAWSQTASSWGTPGLSGTVFLERGQFLHIGMSLTYAMPNAPPGLGAVPGTIFTINESRRVKFYERNYFDHPAFGVIALVTPVQGARAPGR
jgi:hypothetical protein